MLNALIDRSLLDQEAARLRLEVSDDVIRNVITGDPSFSRRQRPIRSGRCSPHSAENHLTEDQYVALLRREIPRDDILLAATTGVAAPPAMVDLLYRYRNEKRVADIVTLPNAGAGDVGQPSEAELTAFYDGHKDLFRAPEYRGFTLASLSPVGLMPRASRSPRRS